MEVSKLSGIILMLVMTGMILGVGILTMDKFGAATASTATVTSEEFTYTSVGKNVTLAHGNLTAVTYVKNASAVLWASANYSIALSTTNAAQIYLLNNESTCRDGDKCYVTYTYKEYVTPTDTEMDNMNAAVGAIGSTWMTLIVTVIALALILMLVLRSFGTNRE